MRTMKKRILGVFVLAVVLIFAMTFTACEGPEGPMGPQGPAGGTDPNCEHNWWSNWATGNNKTCTTGEDKRICQGCLKIETRTNPLGHTVANFNISTQPTETTDGQGTWDCSRTGCTTSTGNSVTLPAWNKFYGTWICTTGSYPPYTLTISATELVSFDKDGDGTKYTSLQMTPTVANSLGGYIFTGTKTGLGISSGNTSLTFTLNGDGKIVSGSGSEIYTKQE